MTERLQALAREIARELAAGDLVVTRGAPPERHDTPSSPAAAHPSIPGRTVSAAAPPGVTFVRQNARMADFIDHTLLKAEATAREIDKLCDEAKEHRFAAVCVNPVWVARCAERLRGVPVQVATVIGFPLGANAPEIKRREAALAVSHGATELDMVVALGHIKSGDWNHVADDIAAVVEGGNGTLVKVIIESAAL